MVRKASKKKKAKITGMPDVVKFKQTREYWLLKECVQIQESLPYVANDELDAHAYKKVARFLNMAGLLADHLNIDTDKDYRFDYHHKYLAPTPQFFPFGYDVSVIRSARQVENELRVKYNGKEYTYSAQLRALSEKFLKEVDRCMTKIATLIEPRLKDDFAMGLKKFKWELREDLVKFDELWMNYEKAYVKENHGIISEVFESIDKVVTLELDLTKAEEQHDICLKQRLENEFVSEIESFCHTLIPETKSQIFPEDVIPLTEGCIFYESKCNNEWLNLSKTLIKDYIELRVYIERIPQDRISPEIKENTQLERILRSFHESVIRAHEPLAFISKLPKIIDTKTSNWMTKRLLEPDLKFIQKVAELNQRSANY